MPDQTAHRGTPELITIGLASPSHAAACAALAQQQREALGFLNRAIFAEAAARGQLFIAFTGDEEVVGFVRFNHRKRGTETAIYDICVRASDQRRGVGRSLVWAVAGAARAHGRTAVVLRCPEGLPAGPFYERVGFLRCGTEPGKRRALEVWRLALERPACSS